MFSHECWTCGGCSCQCSCYAIAEEKRRHQELLERPAKVLREIEEMKRYIRTIGPLYRKQGLHKNFIIKKILRLAEVYLRLSQEYDKLTK